MIRMSDIFQRFADEISASRSLQGQSHSSDESIAIEVPSGNQTWQWKRKHLSVISLLKYPCVGVFPLPCLIAIG